MPSKPTYAELEQRIKELEQVETANFENWSRLQNIGNNLPGGMIYQVVINPGGTRRFTYVSGGVERLHGCTAEQVFADPMVLYSKIVDADIQRVREEEIKAIREMRIFDAVARMKHPSGQVRWHRLVSQPRLLDDGSLVFDGIDLDITDQKEADEEIRQSRDMLELVINSIPQFIFWKNRDLVYSGCNENFARVAGGGDPANIVGKTDYDLAWKKEEADFFRACDTRVMEADAPEYHIIEPQLQADGKQAFLDTNKVPIHDSAGNVIGILGTYEDITKRKVAEDELLREKQFSETVVNQLPGSFYMFTQEGEILRWNENLEQVTGYSTAEVPKMNALDFFPEDERENVQRRIQEAFIKGASQVEANFLTKDGKKVPHYLTGARVEYGAVSYLLGVGLDITERKQVENALKESEEKYRQLVENSNDAIFIAQDGGMAFLNSRTAEILGYSPAEISVTPFPEFIHSDDRDMVVDRHLKRLRGEKGVPDMYAFKIVRKDKIELTVQISSVVIDWNGKPATLNFVRDITDQKRLESMLIQNEKMLSVGGLAAGMAHEINNPLAGIVQTAKVLLDRLTKIDIPANQRVAAEVGCRMDAIKAFMEKRDIPRMVAGITESGHRLAEIVENMLSFARKSEARVSSHSLAELLDKTLELAAADYNLKRHYDFKKIQITKEYEDNLPLIPCEGGKIQQVILNLLNNGAQAMQMAETIKPQLVVRLSLEKARGMIRMEIEDNGPGMRAEIRRKVFEPFFTTKPTGEGTGLGLSVSYFIIAENHGGEMDVESRPGAGTRFIVRLPLEGCPASLYRKE
ncbi:PAS domain S-box protein [Desulfosarcina sp.]|uniref:PAS domain S-box protein n=1 Tax=Desulfosarcina sp. TaxID=2027861 RepID=UPI0029B2C253|nr:PAS domain S-box protein [Desulfosarcina sp.]MDX2451564.1 PAS domain S-box protein [Desulfosarcina sp.]